MEMEGYPVQKVRGKSNMVFIVNETHLRRTLIDLLRIGAIELRNKEEE